MIASVIERRRRQVLVHSILYYKMDTPVITDGQFDALAQDLVRLQRYHPEDSARCRYMSEWFTDFDGSTGFHLPLDDPDATGVAMSLLRRKSPLREGGGSAS